MKTKIQSSLATAFSKHRLIFWYDEKKDQTELFNDIDLPGIEKIVIENNEFYIKYLALFEQPDQKFLIYHAGAKPLDKENWLLDLNLSGYEFRTEAAALYLQELELPIDYIDLVRLHIEFFHKEDNRKAFKKQLEKKDSENEMRFKILALTVGCDAEWDKILIKLFSEQYNDKQDKKP